MRALRQLCEMFSILTTGIFKRCWG